MDIQSKYFLSYDVYHQAVKAGFGLTENAEREYWDILLKIYGKEELMHGLFKSGMESADIYKTRIALPYIKKKSMYYAVRDTLEKATINIQVIDAIDFWEKETEKYDYIDITNILLFVFQARCNNDEEVFQREIVEVLKKIYKENLKEGGCFVIDYMFGITEVKLKSKYIDTS